MHFDSIGALTLGGLLLAGPAAAATPDKASPPDPNQIVQRMCDYLKSLDRFSFRAEVTDDRVYAGGKKLQFGFATETFVQRPDKLRVNAQGDLIDKQFFLNGKGLTLFDPQARVYATAEVPPDIEGALEHADRTLHFRVALADLASPKLCGHLGEGQRHALFVGPSRVGGVAADHLAFDRGDIQFQVWVATGDKPVPVKMVITQKNLPASPQWTATLHDWNGAPHFKPDLFAFSPPAGVHRIPFAATPTTALPAKTGDQP